jgi:hypothetical protein
MEMVYDLGILANADLDTTAAVLQVFVMAALAQPRFLKEGRHQELLTCYNQSDKANIFDSAQPRKNLTLLSATLVPQHLKIKTI